MSLKQVKILRSFSQNIEERGFLLVPTYVRHLEEPDGGELEGGNGHEVLPRCEPLDYASVMFEMNLG